MTTLTSSEDLLNYANKIDLKNLKIAFEHQHIINLLNWINNYKIKNINLIVNSLQIKKRIETVGHWIAIKIINDKVFIYTCYGFIVDGIIDLLNNYKYFYFVLSQEYQQTFNSKSCGFYCLRFLKEFEENDIKKINYLLTDNKGNTIKIVLNNEPFNYQKLFKYQISYLNQIGEEL